jgi:alpha-D-ribose 1-methylphosphonate 5-triphosphate synthase subunit PhnI
MKTIAMAVPISTWVRSGGIEVFLENDEVDLAVDLIEVKVDEAPATSDLAEVCVTADNVAAAPALGVQPRCGVSRAEELLH